MACLDLNPYFPLTSYVMGANHLSSGASSVSWIFVVVVVRLARDVAGAAPPPRPSVSIFCIPSLASLYLASTCPLTPASLFGGLPRPPGAAHLLGQRTGSSSGFSLPGSLAEDCQGSHCARELSNRVLRPNLHCSARV